MNFFKKIATFGITLIIALMISGCSSDGGGIGSDNPPEMEETYTINFDLDNDNCFEELENKNKI